MTSDPVMKSMSQLCILSLLWVCAACACAAPADPAEATKLAQELHVSNPSAPEPGLLCTGQMNEQQFAALSKAGYKSFLNLRAPGEEGTGWEEAAAGELGVNYFNLPIEGGAGINEANARELDRLLASLEKPVVMYCGSANRAGALYGARAFFVQGKSQEESLELARKAGMTRLEGRLQELTSK